MITDETNPSEFKNIRGGDHSHIKGWGIDADPNNDPTYPMKKRTDVEIEGYTWNRPPLQEKNVEILRSVERFNDTAAFGTSVPPSGLSGAIRRQAYKYSESSYGRWLPLVLADRINVFEGLFDDLMKGYVPNTFAERGWAAEWKHNRTSFVTKIAVTAAVATVITAFLIQKKKKKRMYSVH
ncbi:MAG: hypothetical protein ITG00_01505 [Flavobacterium sp.]|nr:hypothetical protein [Flavobacterium sp.]